MLRKLELIAENVIPVSDDRKLETTLVVNDTTVASGLDHYKINATLLSGKRLAGLGRQAELSLANTTAGLQAVEAAPGASIDLSFSPTDQVALVIQTDLFLDQAELQQWIGLQIADDNGKILATMPFARPDIKVTWENRGQFRVDLTGLLS